jgi:hypothetical protein
VDFVVAHVDSNPQLNWYFANVEEDYTVVVAEQAECIVDVAVLVVVHFGNMTANVQNDVRRVISLDESSYSSHAQDVLYFSLIYVRRPIPFQ